MKEFLKPTKAKILITFMLLLILFSISLAWSLSHLYLPALCLPNINGEPTPTPSPFSISQTIIDFKNTQSDYAMGCFGNVSSNDPSAQVAFDLFDIIQITELILLAMLNYLVSCTIMFFASKSKKQKKSRPVNSKR